MRKMTEKQDDALDRKAGIKENSARDLALDAKRGLAGEDKPTRAPRGAAKIAASKGAKAAPIPSGMVAGPGMIRRAATGRGR